MRTRLPLPLQILLWLGLNLLVLGLLFLGVFRSQFGLDSLLAGRAGQRVQAVSKAIAGELKGKALPAWDEVLRNFETAYKADLILVRPDLSRVAGSSNRLPREVIAKLEEQRGPGGGMGRGPPAGRGPRWDLEEQNAEPQIRFFVRTEKPLRYWAGVRLPITDPGEFRPRPLTLVLGSELLQGGGIFFDWKPWLVAGFGAVLFSVLFWLPLVGGLTRSISRLTRATEQLAEGRFEVRVDEHRRDELGRLGQAINHMATRLSGFVSGQKQFLAATAHELCSPMARMQLALGIIEQRSDEKSRAHVEDLREEVQQMSALVDDLLSFSKADLQPEIKVEPVALIQTVQQMLAREGAEGIDLQIPGDLQVLARPELLERALGNLVRNARRYAKGSVPVRIAAAPRGQEVEISVSDSGRGVPVELLDRIFDPFFRLEQSRSRETGGVGLGLAIVKSCVEACRGKVTARNREPSGLEVRIVLARPPQ